MPRHARLVFETRAQDSTFFFIFSLSFHLSPFLLSRSETPNYLVYLTLSIFLSHFHPLLPFNSVSLLDIASLNYSRARARCSSSPSKKSTSANTLLPGLLDSALRSERLRIMDRTDSCLQPLFSPRHSTPSAPFGSYPALTPSRRSSLAGDLRPLRFNLTRHYYVFHRDCSR